MKKILIFVIAAVMIFALAGCTANEAPAESTTEDPTLNEPATMPEEPIDVMPEVEPGTVADENVVGVMGFVTSIEEAGGGFSVMVEALGMQTEATYSEMQLFIDPSVMITDEDGTNSFEEIDDIEIGDLIKAYFSPNAAIAASEPAQGTPMEVVIVCDMEDGVYHYDGKITEITEEGENLLVYIKDDEDSQPAEDVIAVVSPASFIIKNGEAVKAADLAVGMEVEITTDGTATRSLPPQAVAYFMEIED